MLLQIYNLLFIKVKSVDKFCSIIYSFTHSLIHSFIHSFISPIKELIYVA